MRRKVTGALLAGAFALAVPAAAAADNPHAGKSGHFKNSSNPCQNNDDHKKCPPFGNDTSDLHRESAALFAVEELRDKRRPRGGAYSIRAVGRDGFRVDAPFVHVFTFRQSRVMRFEAFDDRD